MAEKKYRKVCKWCGSENVTHDALARWNEAAQEWEISSVLDNSDCDRCGGECEIEDVPMDYDPWAIECSIHRFRVRENTDTKVFEVFHYTPGATVGDATLLETFGRAADANHAAMVFARKFDDVIVVGVGDDYP
jgi:hypothetical protein